MSTAGVRTLGLCALAAFFGACRAGGLQDGVFHKNGVRYRVGILPSAWKPISVEGNDLAFVAEGARLSLAINSTCKEYEDAPLPVLKNHLLMGFTERERVQEETDMLDGREALRARYRAKLDGVPVELLLVVMKKDGCIYDFTYAAPPGHLADKQADFEAVLRQFHTEPAS